MRIGLFGGTFNPIHTGHLRAALEVKEGFELDEMHLIPSAVPPHKDAGGVADAQNRLEMVRLAAGDQNWFVVSEVELQRRGPSYSVDTVAFYRKSLPVGSEIFLVIGADAFMDIHTWKSYHRLFSLVPFIVMVRPQAGASESVPAFQRVGRCLRHHVDPGYSWQPRQQRFSHTSLQSVAITEVTRLHISATRIRELITAGRSIRYLVPDTVMTYIQQRGLYR